MNRGYTLRLNVARCVVVVHGATAALLTAGATACRPGSDAPVSSSATERDSAGVHIVENPAGADSTAQQWVVDTAASLIIGDTSGRPEYEIGSISHVRRLADGHIAAFDLGTLQLRFFDSAGKHVATHGRSGTGPGEFRRAHQVAALGGDTVMVVDDRQSRRSWFSAAAGHLVTSPFDARELRAAITDSLEADDVPLWIAENTVAAGMVRTASHLRDADGSPGVCHDVFFVVDVGKRRAMRVAEYKRELGRLVELPYGPQRVLPGQRDAPRMVADARNHRLCTARPRVAEVTCMDAEGKQLVIRWVPEDVPYPDELRKRSFEQYLDRALREARNPADSAKRRVEAEQLHANREWPPNWFPLENFEVDADRNIWVLEHVRPATGLEQRRYRVFNSAGKHIAFANTFPGYRFEIGSGSVLAVVSDANDNERIAAFRIHKGAGGR